MTLVIAIISFSAAIFLKIVLGNIFFGWVAAFLPVLVVVFWLWRFDFSAALLFAIPAGMVVDAFSLSFFGTHSAIFWGLALASQFLKQTFSENKSFLLQGMSMAVSLVLFFGLVQIIPTLVNIFRNI